MNKIVKCLLVIAVASGLTTSSLFAQEGPFDYDYDYTYEETSAPSQGMSFLGIPAWSWIALGLAVGGVAAVAATSPSTTSHNS